MTPAWQRRPAAKLESVQTRIVVIGGGLIGISCAWHLARDGHRVLLCEASAAPREASWAAAGMLAPHHEAEDDGPLWRLCVAGWEYWPEFLRELGAAAAALDWRAGGGWIRAWDAAELAQLERRHAWLRAAGVEVQRWSPAALARACPGLDPGAGALWLPGGQVDPRRLLERWRAALAALGVEERSGRPVLALSAGEVRLADGERLSADAVVLASGAWTPRLAAWAGLELPGQPVQGQLVRLAGPCRLPGFVREGARYLLSRSDGSVVVGATMAERGFDRSEDPQAVAELAAWARRVVPSLGASAITESWTGLRPRLAHGLPVIARVRPDLWVATGHFRNGVLLAPLTGRLVADLLAGRAAPLAALAALPDAWTPVPCPMS